MHVGSEEAKGGSPFIPTPLRNIRHLLFLPNRGHFHILQLQGLKIIQFKLVVSMYKQNFKMLKCYKTLKR